MSKANIERYIPRALKVLDAKFGDNGEISKTYVGYISAFGMSLVQRGILPTVALHEKEERKDINELVLSVWNSDASALSLLEYVLTKPENEHEIMKEELEDITVALKLCMRVFKLTKGGSDE